MMRKLLALLFPLLSWLFCTPAEAANRFLTCTVTCTITAADTTIWGTTSGGTGASVPGSSDAVILDAATCVGGVTCTATMGAAYNPTWQSITMGACTAATTGCIFDWSVNNNNVTLTAAAAFSGTGTGTRNFKMGNGTWTLSSTTSATIWDMGTTTNLTFNANSSVIALTGNTAGTVSRSFAGGALTYATVQVSASGGPVALSGINTFGTVTMTGRATLSLGANQTISILNLTGSSGNVAFLTSSSLTTARTATITTLNAAWAAFNGIAGSGTATNSFDLGNNSGINILPPQPGGGIIGGWLLNRDLAPANDNNPVGLDAAA